jgi:hypothetical protein
VTTIDMSDGRPKEPRRLRELAAWYRGFAEGAGNPVIWEAQLRTAAELEREADRLEEASEPPARDRVEFRVTKTGKFCESAGKTAESEQLAVR